MPTGSGKTRTVMSLVSDLLRNTEPRLVIWVAYSEELCEQAATEFIQTWKVLGDRPIKLRRFWGDHELDTSNLGDGLLIAGLPKLIKRAADIAFVSKLSEKCSLLIIDEAHQAIAPHYKIVLNALLVQSVDTAMLGLTATPGRTWNDITADEELAEFFARRKVTLKIPGFDSPVDYLVSEGYLAKATFSPLFHQGGARLTEADRVKVRSSLDLPTSVLECLGDDELRNLSIISRI
jgi:DNA repair protein RadD